VFEGILLTICCLPSEIFSFFFSPQRSSSDHDKSIEKIILMKYDGIREYKRRTYAKIGMPKL